MFYVCAQLPALHDVFCEPPLMNAFLYSVSTPCHLCPNADFVQKLVFLPPLFETMLLLSRFLFVGGEQRKICLSE